MTIVTRALRSRAEQQQPLQQSPPKCKGGEDESSRASIPAATRPSPRRSLSRLCSSPAPSSCSSSSSSSSSSLRHGLTRSFRSSHSFCTPSFSSPMSSIKGGRDDGSDGSDDEERTSARLGGCRRGAQASTPDDSNKENVAPHRRLTEAALRQEARTIQEEGVAQRTRARAAAPMSERSLSLAGDSSSAASSSSGTAKATFRRTVSTPISRKRVRGALDSADLEARAAAGDTDVRMPTTPLSRLRLGLSSNASTVSGQDDADSYFSSQSPSVFDSMSVLDDSQTCLTRLSTPDIKDKEEVEVVMEDGEAETLPAFTNIYSHAKALLRYGMGTESQVVGRERERSSLQRFLQKRFGLFAHLEHSASPLGESLDLDGAAESGSLYVCGLPGTGKTALIRSILADLEPEDDKTPKVAFVDCMSVQHPRAVFAKVLLALGQDVEEDIDEIEAEQKLNQLAMDPLRRTLIVLDEIDHLLRNRAHQNILYRVFSLGSASVPAANEKMGSCALIGIANSLDLTERFVPLLASKGAAPVVLNFRPFEAAEMMTVLRVRLSQLYPRYDASAVSIDDITEAVTADNDSAVLHLMEPAALELAAKRIAAATGDLRKTLDACRLAIDAVENEERAKAAAEGPQLSSLTTQTAPKVQPRHILRVLSSVLGSPQLTKLRSLGLQPKLLLLSLLIAQKRRSANLDILGGGSSSTQIAAKPKTEEMRIRDVETTYLAMLKNDEPGAFPSVESSELMDVIEGLEVEGVVRIISDVGTLSSGGGGSSSKGCKTSAHGGIVGVSPSGKRAAKKQLLASNRAVALAMPIDDIFKGISTASPTVAVETSKVVMEAVKRMWDRECDRVERCKSWETMALERRIVREEELGGGRGAVGL